MSWKKFFTASYWTGRSDLYKDSDKVEFVQGELNSIKGLVAPAQSEAQNALAAVNATLANTGYSVDTGALDQVYSYIENMIAQIQQQIETKSNAADEYSKNHQGLSGVLTGTLGTVGMVLSKFGEGVFSAFEDVGDAVGTCFGWVEAATDALGITDKGTTFWQDVVKTDVSHNIFHSINEFTGINKHSYITEDSGIAGLAKTAGVATGYLTMAGWLGGAAQGYGEIRNGARFTKFLASSTNANTVIAGIGGFGSGVENGLQSGQTFARANLTGLIQGGTQAAVAYGMGKLGEHLDKATKVKAAEKGVSDAHNAWKLANDEYAAAIKSGDAKAISSAWKKLEDACLNEGTARRALNTFRNTKVGWGTNSTFQGYTDPVSMRARQQGVKFGRAWATNVTNSGGSGVLAATKGFGKAAWDGVKEVPKNVGNHLKAATTNPANGKFSVRQTVKSTVKDGWHLATTPIRDTVGMVKHGVSTMGVAPGLTIARDALGVVAGTAINANNDSATQLFQARMTATGTPPTAPGPTVTTPTVTTPTVTTPTVTTPTVTTPTVTTPTYPPGGGGDYPPGGGGDDTPTPTTTPTDPITTIVPTEAVTPTTPVPTETTIVTPTSEPQPDPGTPFGPGDGEDHSGGGYSETGGFTGDDEELEPELADLVDDVTTSIDDIINGGKKYKIPTSTVPIARPTQQSSGNAFIPIAAGLSTAAAAGLGAKAYMDKKHADDDDEDIYTDDWSDEDTIDVEDDDANAQEQYLDEDYNYEDVETEKYGARNNEELADLQ